MPHIPCSRTQYPIPQSSVMHGRHWFNWLNEITSFHNYLMPRCSNITILAEEEEEEEEGLRFCISRIFSVEGASVSEAYGKSVHTFALHLPRFLSIIVRASPDRKHTISLWIFISQTQEATFLEQISETNDSG